MTIVREALKAEIMEAMQKSLEFKQLRDDAKTEFKKEYYTKKLVANNLELSRLLEAAERLPNKDEVENVDDQSVSTDEQPTKNEE